MAPIPTVQNSAEKRTARPLGGQVGGTERRSELVTRVKYCNTLPDLPFDTKFIAYPFETTRFVTYSTTSLERNYTYEVLTEPDLGVDVELVIPNAYNAPSSHQPPLDITDEKLLLDDDVIPSQKNQKRSRHHAKSVSWLRRTEYISTEQTRFQPQSIDKVEAKVGYSVKKMLKDDLGHYMDRDSQIKSIEKTFDDAQIPIEQHFAKPGVTPVEIIPVFPDFTLWKYPCAQVIFDSDPAPVGRPVPAQLEEMSQAMIRGVMDESGEQFVAYFLPTEETLAKRKKDTELGQEYEDDEVYEYRMAREYNWNVKSKATKGYEENYFFVIRDNGVYYNELETRVRLNKRRVRGPHQQLNTKLCVKHIPLAASDYKFQRTREKELEPVVEEDEEEEEEEEERKSDEESDKGGKKSGDEKSGDEKSGDEKSEKSEDEDEGPKEKKRKERSKSKSPPSDDDNRKSDKSDESGDEKESSKRKDSSSEDEKSGSDAESKHSGGSRRNSDSESEGENEDDAKSNLSRVTDNRRKSHSDDEGRKSDSDDDDKSSAGGRSDSESSSSSSSSGDENDGRKSEGGNKSNSDSEGDHDDNKSDDGQQSDSNSDSD